MALALPVADAATLVVDISRLGVPLEDGAQGRVYLRPAEAERAKNLPRDAYVAWGTAGRAIRVPDGRYDVVVKYVNDHVEHIELLPGLALSGDVRRSVNFDAPIARLTVNLLHDGQPVPRFEGAYRLHRAGHRGTPVAAKRSGDTLTILPGTYDVELVWRGPDGLTRRWLPGYVLRDEQVEAVEMSGIEPAMAAN